ncbi:hypothetical protein V6N11_020257 [Hibiscus sabdariffa]|uniref:Endonuclease/exonuclease/phosphatase domain-containing protein n=1 Tax=Hibiscus sabdariffa TaxID=183260 RepID=A0ABR2Q7W2_9ROSI
MAMLAWNVRGLGNKDTVRALKNAAFKYKVDIIFLSETKQKKRYIEKIRMKMKFDNAFYVEPDGIAEDKRKFWETLVSFRNDVNAKWCVLGDFNVVVSPEEKYRGNPFDQNSAKWNYEFLDQTYLMEIPSSGGSFTWSNQRCNEESILEKLDRILSSLDWNFLFLKAISIIDVAIASDHSPIILLVNGVAKKSEKEFKFESRWLIEEECSQVVKDEWENKDNCPSRGTFRVKLRRTRVKLSKWNREKLGTNRSLAGETMQQIKELQDVPLSPDEAAKLKDLKAKLLKTWESEEMYWH